MGLRRGKPLQRKSELKSSGSIGRGKGLRPRSKKTEATYVERRKIVARRLDNSDGTNWCQLGIIINPHDDEHRCGLWLADVHEVKTRGRGGSILNEDNLLDSCRPCHDWIGANPKLALELGLVKSSWDHE